MNGMPNLPGYDEWKTSAPESDIDDDAWQTMTNDDEKLYEWLELDELVWLFHEANPKIKEDFIAWVRSKKKIIKDWEDYCADYIADCASAGPEHDD